MSTNLLNATVRVFRKSLKTLTTAVLVIMLSIGFFIPALATAAALVNTTDTPTNEKVSATSDHVITYTQATGHDITAGDTIAIASTGSGNYTANAAGSWVPADFSLTDSIGTAAPVAVGASPSCSSGSNHYTVTISGTVLPIFTITACTTFGTTTTGSAVTFKILGASGGGGTLTNSSSPVSSAPWTITDTGSNTDTTTFATVIITNDIVTVNASVNPTLTFSLGATTVNLGTLTTGSMSFATHTLNVATNGVGGFSVSYTSPTTGLYNGSYTLAALTSGSETPGTEGWGLNLTGANTGISGSAAPVTNHTGSGGSCAASSGYATTNAYTYAAGATAQQVAAASGSDDCTYVVSYEANISSVTPAGSYTVPLTYIATGTF